MRPRSKKSGKSGRGKKGKAEDVQPEEEIPVEEEEAVCDEDLESMNESEEVPEDIPEIPEQVIENPFGFQFSASVTDCFAKFPVTDDQIIFFSGNEYNGDVHEGIIHGHGAYEWKELGATYAGSFNWGNFSGTGRLEWRNSSTYEGDIVNGVRHGHGIYRKAGPSQFVYEGDWTNGVFHGEGTCYYGEQGCKHHYTGSFEQGLRHGFGKMYYPNGNVYEGEWKAGKRHGKGKFMWSDSGSYYVGAFDNGEMHGHGEIVYAFSAQSPSVQFVQSNRYLGDFDRSVRDGEGVFYYANGAVYSGSWKDNLKNGRGTFTSRDGRVYNSEFRDGSIYQDGKLFVPTPSISLSFSLDGLLAPSESADEVMSSLCNMYVRFLPKLRAVYQQYSVIQWADDKTITALRMIGMWRFLQDKGSVLDPNFRLVDADDVIVWFLDKPSLKKGEKMGKKERLARMVSTFGIENVGDIPEVNILRNEPLAMAPDPFATLFLYQLFEALVKLAHRKLAETFPDSLVLQVTRFLENSVFVDDEPPQNVYSVFRKTISTPEFDEVVTKYSSKLSELYLQFSGCASDCSVHQIAQLESAIMLDPHIDMSIRNYRGLMTARDLIIILGDRGFFGDQRRLAVMDVLLFLKFASVSRQLEENEEENEKRFFTLLTKMKMTFVEFVQTLAFVASKLIPHEWELSKKFEYVVEHFDGWRPMTPTESELAEVRVEEEEEKPETPPPTEKKHSRRKHSK